MLNEERVRSRGGGGCSEIAKVVEVIEVLDHQFDDLGIVAGDICVFSDMCSRLEFDDTGFAFL